MNPQSKEIPMKSLRISNPIPLPSIPNRPNTPNLVRSLNRPTLLNQTNPNDPIPFHAFIQCLAITLTTVLGMGPFPAIACDQPSPDSRNTTGLIINFGTTHQGDWLQLDSRNLRTVANGVEFTYYLNGYRKRAMTTCRESTWYLNNTRIQVRSKPARNLLNYVCGRRE
jgi:hypothetical protein